MKIKVSNFQIILYLLLAILSFYLLGYPSLTGAINIQAYSDAKTYETFAKNTPSLLSALLSTQVARNLAGPLLILKLLNFDYVLIFVFNITCLLVSILLLFNYYQVNRKVFLFFLFLNPMTLFALFSVNKEILSLLAIALFMVYIKTKTLPYFIAAAILGYFARWQITLFALAGFALIYLDNFIKHKHRIIVTFLLLTFISMIYPAMSFVFIQVIEHGEAGEIKGSGIFQLMNDIQLHYYGGYLLVYLPKLLQILFGLLSRYYRVLDFSDFWNDVVQYFNSVSFLILTIYLWYKKKINIKSLTFYMAIIYSVVFTITVIWSIRYFYGMYVILALLAAEASHRKNTTETKPAEIALGD